MCPPTYSLNLYSVLLRPPLNFEVFSFPVSMSNDGKYTFVKIACANSSICIEGDAHINVKLVAEYTWKISIFVTFLYLIVIGAIISICFFGRKCLNICCNFTDKKIEQQLDLVE